MDSWGGSTIYDLALTLHTERVARGEAAQQHMAAQGTHPVRAHLAATLVALAARLDPARQATARQASTTGAA